MVLKKRRYMDRKYKILACAGFGYTGSSIISDFLSEFNNVDVRAGSAEFRFLHDFGGISTLEDALVHNYHKQSSDGAIHQYLKMVDYCSGNILAKKYNKWFDGKFKDISLQFINEITEVKWKGAIEPTFVFKPTIVRILYYQLYSRIKRAINGGGELGRFYPKGDFYFSCPDKDFFEECVRRYLNNLFSIIDPNHEKEFLYFDQIVPPTNLNRYLNYFDDIKVVVVDRDPRDLYIQNKYRVKASWIPFDVNDFIKLYKGQRKYIATEVDNKRILRIRFEDAIYNYEKFSSDMLHFIGLTNDNHISLKSKFDPLKSINNTKLWDKYDVDPIVLSKIENELGDYCYNF